MSKALILISLSVLLPQATSAGEPAPALTISITNLESSDGKVSIGLFKNEKLWPQAGKAGEHRVVRAQKGKTVVTFSQLPPGEYAVAVYHDENDNAQLDRGMFGIPSEGYGFSRDAAGMFGPPDFDDAAFSIGGAPVSISLRLAY